MKAMCRHGLAKESRHRDRVGDFRYTLTAMGRRYAAAEAKLQSPG